MYAAKSNPIFIYGLLFKLRTPPERGESTGSAFESKKSDGSEFCFIDFSTFPSFLASAIFNL